MRGYGGTDEPLVLRLFVQTFTTKACSVFIIFSKAFLKYHIILHSVRIKDYNIFKVNEFSVPLWLTKLVN